MANLTTQPREIKMNTNANETPANNLPSWSDCSLRVSNSEYVESQGYEPEEDGHYASELHKFIYEYDCQNDYKSAWWRHRLEKLIDFVKEEAIREHEAKQLADSENQA